MVLKMIKKSNKMKCKIPHNMHLAPGHKTSLNGTSDKKLNFFSKNKVYIYYITQLKSWTKEVSPP